MGRHKPGKPGKAQPQDQPLMFLSYESAARDLSRTLAARTHYALGVAGLHGGLLTALFSMPDTIIYASNPTDTVLRISVIEDQDMSCLGTVMSSAAFAPTLAAVAMVRKTETNRLSLSQLLGQALDPRDEQDIILDQGDNTLTGPVPALLIDAIDCINPVAAAQMRASGSPFHLAADL
ncbi:hypothetical protein [Streptomyces sp. NPDC056544]|uniref:hypothetical protein n=1 Tax=unclassified Streptomyces TaxID=2593676 RepID=UPI00368EEDB5